MADSQGAELHAASDKTSQIYAKLPSTQAIGKLDRVAAAGCSYVGLKATVRYDFVAEGPEELDLTKGQIVKILDMGADDGWWEGECEGDVGIFPESYVEIIEDYKPEPAIEHTSHLDPQDTAGSMGDGSSQTQLVTKPSVGIAPVMPARRENFGAADSLRKSYNPVNRMSSFVKMGAEEYILGNSRVIADVKDDMSIKAGPSWHDRKPFIVEIGAPRSEKKYHGMKSYISYTLTPSILGVATNLSVS
ncbi:hypothetical protein SARC_03877 [Sphaeroforma arctica JP610]|uniref:SH3 domain-containing protein n=1 Tax=Sphaeroforma arctica JP610 TaxID=667725 RepID=A0A0L0G450_9EUKA|nr:hypothetical protein SARC_03877 [Sphaeroforma arctica JP610]KNC83887.1 hypothetical protein SARC_03877 [Sphaeroforma arctica JP610]|eukprot:XP_014157789.1 hypothetical protein SARC_03877 [Sphaeroforma arctica JP610]